VWAKSRIFYAYDPSPLLSLQIAHSFQSLYNSRKFVPDAPHAARPTGVIVLRDGHAPHLSAPVPLPYGG